MDLPPAEIGEIVRSYTADRRATAAGERIDRAAERFVSADGPGFSYLIAREGEILFRGAYGLADIGQGIPIRPEDNFIIASNTKQFACLALLMLQGRGLLALDDTADRFFPGLSGFLKDITVRMLMQHTSGLPEYYDDDIYKDGEWLKYARPCDVLELVKACDRLKFEPGTAFSYCNTAYVIIGEIIRMLSGKPFGEFVETESLKPLGMDRTFAPDDAFHRDPFQVNGYCKDPDSGLISEVPYDMLEVGYADGNISSNVDDMLKWHRFLYGADWTSNKAGPGASNNAGLPDTITAELAGLDLSEMYVPITFKDGSRFPYGLGMMTGSIDEDHRTYHDQREFWHTGGTAGFISRISYLPDEKISAILLTNLNGIERDALFMALMDAAFEEID